MSIKRLTAHLGLMIFGILSSLLLGELLVRLVAPQLTYRFPRDLFVNDAATGYRLHAGFRGTLDTPEYRTNIRINAQGLRADREYGPKRPGVTRILMLGDSFTMGVGVSLEDTAAKQLERGLNAGSPGGSFEVINAGVPGYGTVQEVAYLETYGPALEPDLVLLGFFVGNDVADNASEPLRVRDGYLLSAGADPSGILPIRLRLYLSLHSQLYHLLWNTRERLLSRDGPGEAERPPSVALLYPDSLEGDNPGAMAWRRTFTALARLDTFAQAHGVRAAVVLIPDRLQLSPVLWNRVAGTRGNSAAAPNDRVRNFCEAAGVPVLDLLPVLAADRDPSALYFERDHHWTKTGNARAAAEMEVFVRHLLEESAPRSARLVERDAG